MNFKSIVVACVLIGGAAVAVAQLAADPWANISPAEDKTANRNTLTQKLPNFVGENTTWNTAMGQREIAPDANITNMLMMTQHLRNMGYQIPDGLDNYINRAPKKIRNEIAEAMMQLKGSAHPVATIGTGLAEIFEKNTGLSLENLIMNSLEIIDARR